MADLSKIKLNGTEYDIKDTVARNSIPSNVSDLENDSGYITYDDVDSQEGVLNRIRYEYVDEVPDLSDDEVTLPDELTVFITPEGWYTINETTGTWEKIGATNFSSFEEIESTASVLDPQPNTYYCNLTDRFVYIYDGEGWQTIGYIPLMSNEDIKYYTVTYSNGAYNLNTSATNITFFGSKTTILYYNGERYYFSSKNGNTAKFISLVDSNNQYREFVVNSPNLGNVSITAYNTYSLSQSISNTLSSGTLIATINGTNIYAPTATGGIDTETDPIFSASAAANITSADISAWNAKSNFSGSYNDLSDTPTIPTIPVNISAFTNDSGYLTSYTETDPTVPSWAKQASKPTYTASEVGAAESSHAHGSITNAGAITSNTALASGDRLVFSDSSDSNLLKRSSITIGSSTTQYLANDGSWQNLPTISVSQTITSGTEIGSVNNTKLYAPTPYDDTDLAARVTALEELEWATYYSGRTAPSNSQGQNGDIYLQY